MTRCVDFFIEALYRNPRYISYHFRRNGVQAFLLDYRRYWHFINVSLIEFKPLIPRIVGVEQHGQSWWIRTIEKLQTTDFYGCDVYQFEVSSGTCDRSDRFPALVEVCDKNVLVSLPYVLRIMRRSSSSRGSEWRTVLHAFLAYLIIQPGVKLYRIDFALERSRDKHILIPYMNEYLRYGDGPPLDVLGNEIAQKFVDLRKERLYRLCFLWKRFNVEQGVLRHIASFIPYESF